MKTKTIAGGLLLLTFAVALPLMVRAEPRKGEDDAQRPRGPHLFLALRMAEELGLSDEKALAVARVLREADGKRDELRQKRVDLDERIREALKHPKPDESALAKLVDQEVDLHKQQADLREQSFRGLKKILSVEEQAKLVLLRSEMGHRHEHHRGFGRHGFGHREEEG